MSRRFQHLAVSLTVLTALSGCVQATRHSNTMIFGTNTSVGLKVGNDINQIPVILVGFERQEAVIMPLLANSKEKENSTENLLSPCDVEQEVKVVSATPRTDAPQFAVHPCLFAATNGSSTDSYSVLASFGANFNAQVGDGAKAGGGLAQYFATGMAAQILATTGGAAVINARAEESGPEAAAAVATLFGTEAQRAQTAAFVSSYQKFKTSLRTRIAADADDNTMLARLQRFENNIKTRSRLSMRCQTKVGCLAILDKNNEYPFDDFYRKNGADMDVELAKWTT